MDEHSVTADDSAHANATLPEVREPLGGASWLPMGIRRTVEFLSHWRSLPPYEMASYLFMFSSVPMLARGIRSYDVADVAIVVLCVGSLYAAFFSSLIWNDITDADIDRIAHPDRPIPSGRISVRMFFEVATLFAMLTFGCAYLISVWCLIVSGVAALFVTLHNLVLKRIVRLPAYSEIFTPIQWTVVAVFGYVAIWTSYPVASEVTLHAPVMGSLSTSLPEVRNMIVLALFIYFADASHDIPEGIVDAAGDRVAGVKTYATSFGVRAAARVAALWFVISGILGVTLFLTTSLSYLFLIPFVGLFLFTVLDFVRLIRLTDLDAITDLCPVIGRKGYNYLLFTFDLMFVDLLSQLIARHIARG